MIIFLIIFLIPLSVFSQDVNFDFSQKNIILKNDTDDPNITIFGFNTTKNFVVIKVTGPKQKVILQEKTKFFNMWTWKKSGEFSYPSLFHFYTNMKEDDIDFRLKKDIHDNIKLLGKDDDNLKRELIKNKMSAGLFYIKNKSFDAVDKKNPIFFRIPIKIPYNAPTGKYKVSMETYKKNKIIKNKTRYFFIKKPGFNSFIYNFAHNFSFLYGLVSVIVAIVLGVFAGIIFRK